MDIQKTLKEILKQELPDSNFLIWGQEEKDFLRKISQIFQGAKNATEVGERILAQVPVKESLDNGEFSGTGSVQEEVETLEEPTETETSEIPENQEEPVEVAPIVNE